MLQQFSFNQPAFAVLVLGHMINIEHISGLELLVKHILINEMFVLFFLLEYILFWIAVWVFSYESADAVSFG